MRIAALAFARQASCRAIGCAFVLIAACVAASAQTGGFGRAPASAKLQIVNPFLLPAFAVSPGNLNLASYLADPGAQAAAQAKGLAADGASEVIIVFRADANKAVRFEARGGILTPYADNFLVSAPASGGDALTVRPANFISVNGASYAAALLRAPAGASSLRVTAGQGQSRDRRLTLPVMPPPVILLHGLWGDSTSLEYLAQHLAATPPWSNAQALYAIEYTNYLPFDDVALWGTLDSAVASALNVLDSQHIAGGRVDIVAHSMGGLVARVYSTQAAYRTPRDRGLGRFHQVVTIDTPEAGSALARYLIDHRADVQNVFDGVPGLVWSFLCGGGAGAPKTVEKCLELAGMPLGPPDDPSQDGAVQSLIPGSPNLTGIQPVNPRIPNSRWQAVQSRVTDSGGCNALGNDAHALVYLLNCFLAGTSSTDTIQSVLGAPNDGIVTTASQVAAGGADHVAVLETENLAHTDPVVPWLVGHPTGYVTKSGTVNKFVACWLLDSGDNCEGVSVVINESLAATPAARAATPFLTRRLVIDRPAAVTLAAPVELTGRGVTTGLVRLVVQQRDELGHVVKPKIATLLPATGGLMRAQLQPDLMGNVTWTVWAVFDDGGIAIQNFTVAVGAPAPDAFRGDPNFREIVLGRVGAFFRLRPTARYPTMRQPVRLDGRVRFRLLPGGGAPAVALAEDGAITALRAGTARVEVRFGASVDVVNVIVKPGA